MLTMINLKAWTAVSSHADHANNVSNSSQRKETLKSISKNVSELQEILALRQPTLSQQLSRLRYEGLVDFRREGKNIHYRLASDKAAKIIEVLYEIYCAPVTRKASPAQNNRRKSKMKSKAQVRPAPA